MQTAKLNTSRKRFCSVFQHRYSGKV